MGTFGKYNPLGGSGGISSIIANSPLSVSTMAGVSTLSISQAGAASSGYLSSTDWNTFNNKATLPSQTGNVDKVLVTDGSSASWQYVGLGSGSYPSNTVIVGKAKPSGLTGGYNTIVGTGTTANSTTSGEQNVYIGYNTAAAYNNSYAISLGNSTVNLGDNTIAIGFNAQAYNGGAICIGASSIVNDGTVAIGTGISANAVYSAVMGRGTASGSYAVGIAPFGRVSGNSVSIGYQAGKILDLGTASQNILIGNTAGDAITVGSNNTIIGDIPGTSTLSDTVIIAAGTAERLRIDSSGNVKVPNYVLSPQLYDAGTKTSDFTLDLGTNGPCQQVTINAAGPLVITLSNPVTGGAYLIKIVQGATTGTVTWPAAVKWGAAGTPVLSNVTGKIDIINLYYDGTNYYGTYALGF